MTYQRNPFRTTKYLIEDSYSHKRQIEEISLCEDFAYALYSKVDHLNLHISYFRCMYDHEYIDGLNYFWNAQFVQRTYCTIGLCALFDPPGRGEKKNITFLRLLEVNDFSHEVVAEIERIKQDLEPLRYCRNKIYAHIDQEQELSGEDSKFPYDVLLNEFEATKSILKKIGKGEILNKLDQKLYYEVEFTDYKYNAEELDKLIKTNVKNKYNKLEQIPIVGPNKKE